MLPSSEAVTPPRARAALSSCFTVGFVFRFVTPCRIGCWFRPPKKFLDRDPVIPQISNQCHTVHRRAMPTLLRGRTKTPRQGSADTHTHTHSLCLEIRPVRQSPLGGTTRPAMSSRPARPPPGPRPRLAPLDVTRDPAGIVRPTNPSRTTSEKGMRPGRPASSLRAHPPRSTSPWTALQGCLLPPARLCSWDPDSFLYRKSGRCPPTSGLTAP